MKERKKKKRKRTKYASRLAESSASNRAKVVLLIFRDYVNFPLFRIQRDERCRARSAPIEYENIPCEVRVLFRIPM